MQGRRAMNKAAFIFLVMLLLSTFSFAGKSSISALEPVIEVPMDEPYIADNHTGFYFGLGLTSLNLKNDISQEEFSAKGLSLQAGYQFNEYLAIESRYIRSMGDVKYDHGLTSNLNIDDYPTDFTNTAIYLKPMYSVEDLNLYALLGYGEVEFTSIPSGVGGADRAEDGFQWGVGASYDIADNLSIFVDYTRLYDDKGFDYLAQSSNIVSDVWTLGISYKF